VLAAVDETKHTAAETGGPDTKAEHERAEFVSARLEGLRAFFSALDTGIAAFTQGKSVAPETLQNVLRMAPTQERQRS